MTAAQLGATWRPGCPVGPARLRLLDVPYRDFTGHRRTGRLVLNSDAVDAVRAAFARMYAAGYRVERMLTVDRYAGDDERSMEANNTSAFNCRPMPGGGSWSEHAYGRAVDVNPLYNPYVKGDHVEPVTANAWVDRTTQRHPAMILPGSQVVRAFRGAGWGWGGEWTHSKDYQHFSASGW